MMAFAANKDYENKIIELCYLNILLLALKVKRKCLLSFIIYIYVYVYMRGILQCMPCCSKLSFLSC